MMQAPDQERAAPENIPMKHAVLKWAAFAFFTAGAIGLAYPPLRDLLREGQGTGYYSHIPLIPVVSALIIFRRRKDLFGRRDSLFLPGSLIIAAGMGLFLVRGTISANTNDYASASTLSALLIMGGSFLLLFRGGDLRRAFFPFAFLLFAVPIPSVLMERIVAALVAASTVVTRSIFEMIGVPLVQEGAVFHLPGFSLEIARECSGIRSSLALLITSVLAGHLFLKRFRSQALLALAVFPVAIFKNAVRIVTLYLLSYFIDMRIIEGGFLHRSGGFIFFGMGLAVLGFGLWLLRHSELSHNP
jgi:exosortase